MTFPLWTFLGLLSTFCLRIKADDTSGQGITNIGQVQYHNPIISGFAPDPSCIRVEERYFCVTSSFSAFPGIPVYTSRDLVDWQQIGNVLSRPEQLPDLNTISTSTGGIWASTIRYRQGTFYVITTLVKDQEPQDSQARWDNLIFTTTDVFANDGNGWSDPVHFTFQGYDTSVFWDDDGTTYIQGSHYWRVFPAIEQFVIDLETGTSLSGDPVIIWNGTGGMAPEGPHVYKRDDGYYYLLIAEGGTGLGHMVTMARSTDISGPYTSYESNPVLTNANTSSYLQTVGHSDLFDDVNGNWWGVALATRNGSVNFPMGRETVLVPVSWEDGEYPVFNNGTPGRVHINMAGPLPPKRHPTTNDSSDPLVGHPQNVNFESSTKLPRQFVYFRYPDFSAFVVSPPERIGTLRIIGSAENITGSTGGGLGTSTFVSRRQDALLFTTEVGLEFAPNLNPSDAGTEGEEAGLTVFLQRNMHFDLGIIVSPTNNSLRSGLPGKHKLRKFVQLRTITVNSSEDGLEDTYSQPGFVPLPDGVDSVRLRVQAVNESIFVFSYAEISTEEFRKGKVPEWNVVGYGEAREISGGFTGTLVGMYATGNGHNSLTPAYFSNFSYNPVQGVY